MQPIHYMLIDYKNVDRIEFYNKVITKIKDKLISTINLVDLFEQSKVYNEKFIFKSKPLK